MKTNTMNTQDKDTTLDELRHILGTCSGSKHKDCWFNNHDELNDNELDVAQEQALLQWRDKAVVEARLDEAKMHDFVNVDERIAHLQASLNTEGEK